MPSEHSQKIVVAKPWIGYSARAGAARMEIPAQVVRRHVSYFKVNRASAVFVAKNFDHDLLLPCALLAQRPGTSRFGGEFQTLAVYQQELLTDWAKRRAEVPGAAASARKLDDSTPESLRKTFEGVTHKLLHTRLQAEDGRAGDSRDG